MKDIAIKAAYAAGEVLIKNFKKKYILQKNNQNKIVTDIDLMSEDIIIKIIKKSFPEHEILSEETRSKITNPHDYLWIIDPLDGTINYISGNPFFNVTIALQLHEETILGVTYSPITNELFVADKNSNLQYNNRQLKINGAKKLSDAILCVDWSHCNKENQTKMHKLFSLLTPKVRTVLSYGCGALSAAHVATGYFDVYFNIQSYPWDHIAACFMVQKAGGISTTVNGDLQKGLTHSVLVSNNKLHNSVLEYLKKVL